MYNEEIVPNDKMAEFEIDPSLSKQAAKIHECIREAINDIREGAHNEQG